MKKVLTAILLIVSVLSFSACSGKSTIESTPNPIQTQSTTIPTSSIEPTYTYTRIPIPTEIPYEPKDYFIFKATPQSDCFDMIAYNEVRETLLVCFGTTGVYFYFDFPETEYEEFKEADSLGSYFIENIKGKYSYEKGTETDWDYIQYLLDEESSQQAANDWVADYSDEIPGDYDSYEYYYDYIESTLDDYPDY